MANRYQDLLLDIPRGSHYATGQTVGSAIDVLPYRDTPYEFRFGPVEPSQTHGVFVNGTFRGTVLTEADGYAVVSVLLDQGANVIELLDTNTTLAYRTYVTTAVFAVWLAAHAKALEVLDAQIADVRAGLSLSTAPLAYVERYGREVNHPNEDEYQLEAYRNLLVDLRRAYRRSGGRLGGVREAVQAVTSSVPWLMPQEWLRRFRLDDDMVDVNRTTVLADDADPFPNLNARALDYVCSGAPSTISPVVADIVDPGTIAAQPLTVTFTGWDGGNVIIEGLDQTDQPVTDTFVAGVGTVFGVNNYYFSTVTEIRFSYLGTTGTIDVGLATSKFVTLKSLTGPWVRTGGSATPTLALTGGLLQLNGGPTLLPSTGPATLTGGARYASPAVRLAGLGGTSTVGGTLSYSVPRLYLSVDRNSPLAMRLPASPATVASLVDAVNHSFETAPTYGAQAAEATIVVTGAASGTFTLTDADGVSATFEADSDGAVTGSNIPFDDTGGTTTANAIVDAINESGLAMTAAANSTVVTVWQSYGGTAGNTTSVDSVSGVSVGSFSGGVDGVYAPASELSNSVADSDALLLASGPAEGTAAQIALHQTAADASVDLLGMPRRRTTSSGALAVGDLEVPCDASALPAVPTVVLHDSVDATTALVSSGFSAPDTAAPVEAWFSPDYDGDDLHVTGTDLNGDIVTDTLVFVGAETVDSGVAGTRGVTAPGTCASVRVGTYPSAWIDIYAMATTGTAGNALTVTAFLAGGPNLPLSVAYSYPALTITLATDGSGALHTSNNHPVLVATAIESLLASGQPRFRVRYGTQGGTAIAPQGVTSFTGGSDTAQLVEVTHVAGDRGNYAPFVDVRPGDVLSVGGESKRILYVGSGGTLYPPAAYSTWAYDNGTTATSPADRLAYGATSVVLYLESALAAPVFDETWSVTRAQVVKGETLFASITAVAQETPGTQGRYQLRVRDAVEDYGVRVRLGRGLRASGASGALSNPRANQAAIESTTGEFATFAATGALAPQDSGGRLYISSSTARAGANNGVHEIPPLDPAKLGALSLTIHHERAADGIPFSLVPSGGTNWNVLVSDTGLTWALYALGETAVMVGNSGTSITLAEPGVNWAHASGIAVEDEEVPYAVSGEEEGLERLQVDVEPALQPADTSDTFTVQGGLPDGWRAWNASSYATVDGYVNPYAVRLVDNGGTDLGGGLIIEVVAPQLLERRGLPVRIDWWVEGCTAGTTVTPSVSWDDGLTFASGSAVAPNEVVIDEADPTLGGGDPVRVSMSTTVPTDATSALIRLSAATSIGDTLSIEACYVDTHGWSTFDTLGLHATHAKFRERLFAWCTEELTESERARLGLPDPARAEVTVADKGHIDALLPAHVYGERKLVEWPIEGHYPDVEWDTATLQNFEVVPMIPGRLSYLSPVEVSEVVETLSVVAPSNATLAETSDHEGPFPEAPSADDQLLADGVPVPHTSWPGTRATALIGSADPDSEVEVTATVEGLAGNGLEIVVDNTFVGTRPRYVTWDESSQTVTVYLAVTDSALSGNTGLVIAELLNASVAPVTAEVTGDGSVELLAAEGPTAFAGAQATPWRFLSATEVQIASLAAGDSSDVAEYQSGVPAVPSGEDVFEPSAEWTLTYQRLTRVTTAVLDLGTSHADYAWLVDAAYYLRAETDVRTSQVTEAPLLFDSAYRATLKVPATRNKNLAVLTKNTGIKRVTITNSKWSFVSATEVQIQSSVFDANSIFTLTYEGRAPTYTQQGAVKIEHRAGTSGSLTGAWTEVQLHQIVGLDGGVAQRYHQLRMTVSGISDTRDLRVNGLGLLGVPYTVFERS